MNPLLTKGWSLILAIGMLVSVNAQKTAAPKPIALKKALSEKLPVTKKVVYKKGKIKNFYYADTSFRKFGDGIFAELNTEAGKVILKLHYEEVPMTVANFIGLSEGMIGNTKGMGKPYYDSLTFHNVFTQLNGNRFDFLVQTGDPTGTGTGNPGYVLPDEFNSKLMHDKPGIMGMASAGPNTNGSQFYITLSPAPWLNNKYTAFGTVVQGLQFLNLVKLNSILNSVRIIRVGTSAINFQNDSAALQMLFASHLKKTNDSIFASNFKSTKPNNNNLKPIYKVEDYYDKFNDGIYAEINTDLGNIVIKLHYDKAPLTSMNFIGLAEGTISNNFRELGKPYYDNLKFHRVISDFMIQGGDPTGTGSGGPGYSFQDEFHPELRHSGSGILSMANSGPNTNGSQFFITHVATQWLDDKHSVFGSVVEGQNVVNAVQTNSIMNHIRIIRIGAAAKAFKCDNEAFEKMKKIKEDENKMRLEKLQREKEALKTRDFGTRKEAVLAKFPKAKQTASGLWYVITKPGSGANAQAGDKVSMFYELTNGDGKIIESNFGNNAFSFVLGEGKVIKGWDEGIALMNAGAECTFIIPSALAYGDEDQGGDIPAYSTLIFKTKLDKIVKGIPKDFALIDKEVKLKFPKAKKTASGLWYVETKKGTGAIAKAGQRVKMQYTLKLADGEVLESNMQDEPLKFTLGAGEVIEGWDEGIALMNAGSEYTLIIPSKLAYGHRGSGRKIGPNTSLIFETKLIDISAPLAADFAEDDVIMKKEFPDAVKTSSGLWYIMRNPGTDPKPTPGQTVSVIYRGTFGDGREFDKNINPENPFEFPLGQGRVIKGWDEGIAMLGKGGYARFIIPSKLAYGKTGFASVIGPNTTLIFDVQLLGAK